MTADLINVVKSLEMLLKESPLSNMCVFASDDEGPLAVTHLFAKRGDMEKARKLETAKAAGLITQEQYEEEFPNVLFIAVNANYRQGGLMPTNEGPFAREGARLLIHELKDRLTKISMELCYGMKDSYVPDDSRHFGGLLFRTDFQPSSGLVIVSEILTLGRGNLPQLQVARGDTVLDAFKKLEAYVLANGD